ncbi:hypothetical protein [Wolbachia endosymbiont of Pentidionis agamae]|uniref:hypothetical protein n=1 Tax=Wolbachia endosymbiont of Pentidionis agamae TaxID=3110435 RepID=UPI002FCFEDE4
MFNEEPQGPNIAAIQSQSEHQQSAGEKSGFGIGLADFIRSTEGGSVEPILGSPVAPVSSLSQVFEGGTGSVNKALGGDGIEIIGGFKKFIDTLIEAPGYAGGGGEQAQPHQDAGVSEYSPEDYPYYNDGLAHNFSDDMGMHYDGDASGQQQYIPSHTPHHDYDEELGRGV